MANRYICQLRRGIRYVDDTGATLLDSNGVPVKDDWATYTAQPGHKNPLDGELVLEYEHNPKTGKTIPRFKIGYNDTEFGKLDYISPDSFVLPTRATVTLYPDKWESVNDENGDPILNRHIQYVTIDNATITPNSKVDLQISPEDLIVFSEKDITFTTINAGGQVRVCVIGQRPTREYQFAVSVTEVTENA